MSKKDFDQYYQTVCDQYIQLREELDVFQKMLDERVIEPERLETLKKTFQPVLDTYQMVSWVAFLLNKPVNSKKRQRHDKMLKKKIGKLMPDFSPDSLVNKNEKILNDIHNKNTDGDVK